MKLRYLCYIFIVFSHLTFATNHKNNPPNPTIEEYAHALISVLGNDARRFEQAIRSLAAYCALNDNFETGLDGHCDDLFRAALNGNKKVVIRVMRALRPRETVQQNRMSTNIVATQQSNILSRMNQIRTVSNFNSNGLIVSQGNQSIPLSYLTYLSTKEESNSSFNSPWGFFINGRIESGDYEYSDSNNEGFDFDTHGITAGIDYRINNKLFTGLALGYSNFDSNTDDDSTMETESNSISFYASYNPTEQFYIDARLSYANTDHIQSRNFGFNLDGNQVNRNAIGETNGNQKSYIVSTGFVFNNNSIQFTPSLSVEYYDTQVDAFVEQNANGFNVGYSEQNMNTLKYVFSFNLSKNISLSKGVLIPSISFNMNNENQTGDEFIFMRVSGMPPGEFFNAETRLNDNNYNTANLGFTFVASNGKQAYLQYSKAYNWQGINQDTISLGARFEF